MGKLAFNCSLAELDFLWEDYIHVRETYKRLREAARVDNSVRLGSTPQAPNKPCRCCCCGQTATLANYSPLYGWLCSKCTDKVRTGAYKVLTGTYYDAWNGPGGKCLMAGPQQYNIQTFRNYVYALQADPATRDELAAALLWVHSHVPAQLAEVWVNARNEDTGIVGQLRYVTPKTAGEQLEVKVILESICGLRSISVIPVVSVSRRLSDRFPAIEIGTGYGGARAIVKTQSKEAHSLISLVDNTIRYVSPDEY